MIPLSGHHDGEVFAITAAPRRELLLRIQGARGEALAIALGGRYASGLRAYYLTSAKAEKWYALFAGGAVAISRYRFGARFWTFSVGVREGLALHEAIALVRAEAAS